MKVTHIITGLNDGGAEAVLYRLILKSPRPFEHHVISLMGPGKYASLLEETGANVTCLNMRRGNLDPNALWRLYKLIKELRPNVVQTWMYHSDLLGGLIARACGVKRVCWGIHHTDLEAGKSSQTTIRVAQINAKLSHWIPCKIVCCAEKARIVHEKMGYDDKKITVIQNGYDLIQFRKNSQAREKLRAEWKIRDSDFLIGMVGRLDPQKDHANLLESLAQLSKTIPSFIAVLVGNGLDPQNKDFGKLIAQKGLLDHVRLLGQRSDIPDVMSALDLHILSSASEAFPNVLAEAMACETPCVSTDVGDAELIIGDTGWIVPARNPMELARAIGDAYCAMKRGESWKKRQEAARKRVEDNFSLERMVQSYHTIWSA